MSSRRTEAPRSRTRKEQTLAFLAIVFFTLACLYYLVQGSNPCEGQTVTSVLIMLLGGTATVFQAQRRWLAGAAIIVVALGLEAVIHYDLPFVTRWTASQFAFDNYVSPNAVRDRTRRIGLFHIENEFIAPDGSQWFHFTAQGGCTACAICLECGVVWLPPSLDRSSIRDSLRPIGGNWFRFNHCT